MRNLYLKKYIKIIVMFCLVLLIVMTEVTTAKAEGWIDKTSKGYETIYGKPGSESEIVVDPIEEEELTSIEEIFSDILGGLARGINYILRNKYIDLSLDGVILGRMSGGLTDKGFVTADFTHFGLEPNNPWGIIGATLFYTFRDTVLVALPCLVLFFLIASLFHDSPQGRARLKEFLMQVFVVFALLFIIPFVIDVFIYIRDGVLYVSYQAMTQLITGDNNVTVSGGIIQTMIERRLERRTILNGLLLLASVFAGVFYLYEYIMNAFLLCFAFGAFPIIAVMSLWNKKKLSEWANIVFPVLLIPLFDVLALLVPSILNALFFRIFNPQSAADKDLAAFLMAIISIIVIWTTIIIRQRIIKLLGYEGMSGSRAIGNMVNTLAHLKAANKNNSNSGNDSKKEEDNSDSSSDGRSGDNGRGNESPSTSPTGGSYDSDGSSAVSGFDDNDSDSGRNNTDAYLEGDGEVSGGESLPEGSSELGIVDSDGETEQVAGEGTKPISSGGVVSESDIASSDNLESGGNEIPTQSLKETPIPATDEMKNRVAENENFEATQYKNVLSPEQQQAYQRNRERNQYRQISQNKELSPEQKRSPESEEKIEKNKEFAKKMGKVAGGAALGTAGVFAAAYGGPSASLAAGAAGAYLGSDLGEKAGDKIGEIDADVKASDLKQKYAQLIYGHNESAMSSQAETELLYKKKKADSERKEKTLT